MLLKIRMVLLMVMKIMMIILLLIILDNTLLKIRMVLFMGNDNDFVVKYGDHDKDCVAVDFCDDSEDVKVLNLNLSLARNVFLHLEKSTKKIWKIFNGICHEEGGGILASQ